MVDHRAGDPILAPHRARGATVAGVDSSLLVRLAGADQFCSVAVPEVSRRITSLLQRDRLRPGCDWYVLPPVSALGRRSRCLYLLLSPFSLSGLGWAFPVLCI